MRLTVGPLPSAVYWRRRALVLGGALLVLFLIAQACMAVSASPGGGTADGSEQPSSPSAAASLPTSPSATAPASATAAPDDDGDAGGEVDEPAEDDTAEPDGDRCEDDEIEVTAVASATTVAVGETATFKIRIAHAADRPCQRDVGGGQRELFLVRGTGADHVWSSRACDPPQGEEVVTLTEGIEREHRIEFVGRSNPPCDRAAAAGELLEAGEYHLFARLGTALSDGLKITLTDG